MVLPLSGNNNGLTHPFLSHGSIRVFRNRKQMRLELAPPPSTVGLDDLRSIESNALKRIDGDEYDSTVGVNAVLSVTVTNCMKNWLRLMIIMFEWHCTHLMVHSDERV